MKPQTIWASVVIVFILVTSATILVVMDKDVSIILTLAAVVALPVLSALGVAFYHKLEQVKEISNGGFTKALDSGNDAFNKMMEMQQRTQEQWQKTQDQLAALAMTINPMQPPVSSAPPEEAKPLEGDHVW